MRRGTLLEVILAVTVLALIGTMVYGGFAQTALNKARVEEDVDHSRVVHMALERLTRELSMAFVSTPFAVTRHFAEEVRSPADHVFAQQVADVTDDPLIGQHVPNA